MSAVDLDNDPDMTDVWRKLQAAKEPNSREDLLFRLAEFALEQHDFSDPDIDEDVHDEFELLRRARENYHLVGVRVGRFVARLVEENELVKDLGVLSVEDPNPN